RHLRPHSTPPEYVTPTPPRQSSLHRLRRLRLHPHPTPPQRQPPLRHPRQLRPPLLRSPLSFRMVERFRKTLPCTFCAAPPERRFTTHLMEVLRRRVRPSIQLVTVFCSPARGPRRLRQSE